MAPESPPDHPHENDDPPPRVVDIHYAGPAADVPVHVMAAAAIVASAPPR